MTDLQKGEEAHEAKARLLIVDDEESMRYYLKRTLRRHHYQVETAESGEEAIRLVEEQPVDLALVDLMMPGVDGLGVLKKFREIDPEALVILMTGYGTISTAVESMRGGAFDYITKPFETEELLLLLDRALAQRATLRENRELREIIDNRRAYAGLIGQSRSMRSIFQTIDLVRESTSTVLISGESGTGKELVARAIHFNSTERRGAFVPLNCAALPETLFESELFGHRKGAFTGASKNKLGLIERANGGTLFLDEISEIPLASQAKLLRFLQEREFLPLGGVEAKRVDVRIIAASNRDLGLEVETGGFRQDLFFRLNVVPILIPPLRERREDVPILASHFLEQFARSRKKVAKAFANEAMIALSNHDWPGNVRELENTIERLLVLHDEKPVLGPEDLPEQIQGKIQPRFAVKQDVGSFREAQQLFERDYLTEVLRQAKGNISQAARIAGLSRPNLHRRVSDAGLDPNDFRQV